MLPQNENKPAPPPEEKKPPEQPAVEVTVPDGTPTIERIYDVIVGKKPPATTVDDKRKEISGKITESRKTVTGAATTFEQTLAIDDPEYGMQAMRTKFYDTQRKLHGLLPTIPDLNLRDPAEARKQIEAALSETLPKFDDYLQEAVAAEINEWREKETRAKRPPNEEALKKKQEEVQKQLKDACEQDYNAMREAYLSWYVALITLGAERGNTDPKNNVEERVKNIQTEEDFKKIARKDPPADENYVRSLSQLSDEEFKKKMEKEATAVSGCPGLYVKTDPKGDKVFMFKQLNESMLKKIMEEKRHSKSIDWTNLDDNEKRLVEKASLKQWKLPRFVPPGAISPLFQTMLQNPSQPWNPTTNPMLAQGDWSGLTKNILGLDENKPWYQRARSEKMLQQLLQNINGDMELLKEYWSSIQDLDPKQIEEVSKHLSKDQRKALALAEVEKLPDPSQKAVDPATLRNSAEKAEHYRKEADATKAKQEFSALVGKDAKRTGEVLFGLNEGQRAKVIKGDVLDEEQRAILIEHYAAKIPLDLKKLEELRQEVHQAQDEWNAAYKELDKIAKGPKNFAQLSQCMLYLDAKIRAEDEFRKLGEELVQKEQLLSKSPDNQALKEAIQKLKEAQISARERQAKADKQLQEQWPNIANNEVSKGAAKKLQKATEKLAKSKQQLEEFEKTVDIEIEKQILQQVLQQQEPKELQKSFSKLCKKASELYFFPSSREAAQKAPGVFRDNLFDNKMDDLMDLYVASLADTYEDLQNLREDQENLQKQLSQPIDKAKKEELKKQLDEVVKQIKVQENEFDVMADEFTKLVSGNSQNLAKFVHGEDFAEVWKLLSQKQKEYLQERSVKLAKDSFEKWFQARNDILETTITFQKKKPGSMGEQLGQYFETQSKLLDKLASIALAEGMQNLRKGRIDTMSAQIERLEQQLKSSTNEATKLQLNQQILQLKNIVKNFEADLVKHGKTIQELTSETQELRGEISKLEGVIPEPDRVKRDQIKRDAEEAVAALEKQQKGICQASTVRASAEECLGRIIGSGNLPGKIKDIVENMDFGGQEGGKFDKKSEQALKSAVIMWAHSESDVLYPQQAEEHRKKLLEKEKQEAKVSAKPVPPG